MKLVPMIFALVTLLLPIGGAASKGASESASRTLSRNDLRNAHEQYRKANENVDNSGSLDLHSDGRFLSQGTLECYSCEAPHCENPEEVSICRKAVRCFTAHMRDVNGVEHKSKGCTRDSATTSFYCIKTRYDGFHVHQKNQKSAQYAFDCCTENLCNNQTVWPQLPDVPDLVTDEKDLEDSDKSQSNKTKVILAILCPIVLLGLSVSLVLILLKRRHEKRMKAINDKMLGLMVDQSELMGLRAHAVGDSTLKEYRNDITSGSGSGMPHLMQRTLAKQIHLEVSIGKGKYGEVWRGVWNGEAVAVKLFQFHDESSFLRETDIYTTTLLRHENILGFIGSDVASVNGIPYSWLITHYHHYGSLYDYLNRPYVITPQQALKFIYSALNGIVHLHTEICTVSAEKSVGKPGIAHRDLKTKNILVKADLTCCIADFGLAVTHKGETDELTIPSHQTRVGTKRYMSPEVLDLSILEKPTFVAFQKSDMYSFSLAMWEVLRRTELPDHPADPYALPFFEFAGPDPDFEEMRQIVCVAKQRPKVCDKWLTNHISATLAKFMRECWNENPSVRHHSLRLKKSLANLVPTESLWGSNFKSSSSITDTGYAPSGSVSFS